MEMATNANVSIKIEDDDDDVGVGGFNAHPSVQSLSKTDSSDPSLQIKQDKDDNEIEVTNIEVSGKGKKGFEIKALKTTEPKDSSKSRKRDSFSANLGASLSALAESNKRIVNIIETKHNAKSTSVSVTSQDHGEPQGQLAKCIQTLNAMEDLDGPLYTKGMKLRKDEPSWRPTFLGMSEQRKGLPSICVNFCLWLVWFRTWLCSWFVSFCSL
ncbi:hypothetical protein RHMOL_Rhmol02G0189700 [Rhododendron molle]|uniref:Uncharacterized protein n=1 Tax=Rhododendron molle TaxID=49168 RepID=A0ACC0PRK5_RHOML|nr:hypothetical protein RHMOL_Rhmol02G0189700 [Rhododendron molle]